jgi:endonuclease-3
VSPRNTSGRKFDWPRLLSLLAEFYSRGNWRTPVLRTRGADPFLVLVSTILSQRSRDEVTERATLRLLAEFPTPAAMAKAPLARVLPLIREVGLANSKARAVISASRVIVERFDSQVPRSVHDLLSLPMVGPKTAHAVRVFGYERPGLPVDVHILRVARRLGATRATTIAAAQIELAGLVPRRYWFLINPILVQHGQNLCSARDPNCGVCPVFSVCGRVGLDTPS